MQKIGLWLKDIFEEACVMNIKREDSFEIFRILGTDFKKTTLSK